MAAQEALRGATDLVTSLREGGLTKDRATQVAAHVGRIKDLLGTVKVQFELVIAGQTPEARDPDASFSTRGLPPPEAVVFDPETVIKNAQTGY